MVQWFTQRPIRKKTPGDGNLAGFRFRRIPKILGAAGQAISLRFRSLTAARSFRVVRASEKHDSYSIARRLRFELPICGAAVMVPETSWKIPGSARTFSGQSVENPTSTVRFDITPRVSMPK